MLMLLLFPLRDSTKESQGWKKEMNYLENIVNNETEWWSVLNVEKDLNQMLKIMNPKKPYESTFWAPAASLQTLPHIFSLDKPLCLPWWKKSSMCDQLCMV